MLATVRILWENEADERGRQNSLVCKTVQYAAPHVCYRDDSHTILGEGEIVR